MRAREYIMASLIGESPLSIRELVMREPLLLRFPELKVEDGPVRQRLLAAGAGEDVLAAWRELVAAEITPEQDEDEFDY